MTIQYKVVCVCGHEGTILVRENDTPYSGNFWEYYSLVNLAGRSYFAEADSDWETVLKHMDPSCPHCKRKITTKNIIME